MIYADNAATTPLDKDAFEAMWNRLEDSQKTAPLIKISIYLTIESV